MSDSLSFLKKMRPARGPRRVLWLWSRSNFRSVWLFFQSVPENYLRGGANYITELEGVVLDLSGDESRDVGHVAEEVGTLPVGDLPEATVVPVTRVSGSSTDEDSGLEELGVGVETLVVDQSGLEIDLVREGLEVDGRGGDLLLGGL